MWTSHGTAAQLTASCIAVPLHALTHWRVIINAHNSRIFAITTLFQYLCNLVWHIIPGTYCILGVIVIKIVLLHRIRNFIMPIFREKIQAFAMRACILFSPWESLLSWSLSYSELDLVFDSTLTESSFGSKPFRDFMRVSAKFEKLSDNRNCEKPSTGISPKSYSFKTYFWF